MKLNSEKILDIFYKNIIYEAQKGRINCLTYYNMVFSTNILEENKNYECLIDDDNLLIPTLIIKNKQLFDELLIEYVDKAMNFYDIDNFDNEILDYKAYDVTDKICQEKVIMTLLFANATYEDFNDPINFLRKRIDFLNEVSIKNCDLGYSEILNSSLFASIDKDIINNETPYQFTLKCISLEGEEFVFPKVKFGISKDTVYIYAIQNDSKLEGKFGRKINRILYKIGEGFSTDYENEKENLKDITSSFLVSLNVFLSYFNEIGYKNIIVPSILIERWNAKAIANSLKIKKRNLSNEQAKELIDDQVRIQYNLTNKFIRTFLRLEYHYNNIDIVDLPYGLSSYLILKFNDKEMYCNNPLLLETGLIARKSAIDRKILK